MEISTIKIVVKRGMEMRNAVAKRISPILTPVSKK